MCIVMCLDGSGICAVVFWLQLHFPPKLELGYTVLQSCSYFANVLISVQLLETTSKACANFDFFFFTFICANLLKNVQELVWASDPCAMSQFLCAKLDSEY